MFYGSDVRNDTNKVLNYSLKFIGFVKGTLYGCVKWLGVCLWWKVSYNKVYVDKFCHFGGFYLFVEGCFISKDFKNN